VTGATSFLLYGYGSLLRLTQSPRYLSVVNPGPESIEYELIITDQLTHHSTEEPWSWKSFFVGVATVLGIIVGVIAIFVIITIAKNNRRRVDVVVRFFLLNSYFTRGSPLSFQGNETPQYNKLLNQ